MPNLEWCKTKDGWETVGNHSGWLRITGSDSLWYTASYFDEGVGGWVDINGTANTLPLAKALCERFERGNSKSR